MKMNTSLAMLEYFFEVLPYSVAMLSISPSLLLDLLYTSKPQYPPTNNFLDWCPYISLYYLIRDYVTVKLKNQEHQKYLWSVIALQGKSQSFKTKLQVATVTRGFVAYSHVLIFAVTGYHKKKTFLQYSRCLRFY